MLRYFCLVAFCLSWVQSDGQYTFQAQKFQLGNGNPNSQLQEADKTNPKEIFFTPFIGPGYTPDAGLVIAGGALISFKTNPSDTFIQRSILPVTFVYSTRGSISFNSNFISYWWKDKFRLNLDFKIEDTKSDYWGVGYDAGFEVPQSDTTTTYKYSGFKFKTTVYFKLIPNLYGGIVLDLNKTKVSETNPVMVNDPDFIKFGPDNYNTGIGVTALYDTRDIASNAWKGLYVNLSYLYYSDFLGGDNEYQIVEFDFRHYKKLERDGNTFAVLFKGRIGFGDVPYAELSKLGGSTRLRGYVEGQFRDQSGVTIIGEYRHTFLKNDGSLSKQGMVVWMGTGTIFNRLENTHQWLSNLGFGYRFEVQPRSNIRIDLGIGRETTGFYISFNEAF